MRPFPQCTFFRTESSWSSPFFASGTVHFPGLFSKHSPYLSCSLSFPTPHISISFYCIFKNPMTSRSLQQSLLGHLPFLHQNFFCSDWLLSRILQLSPWKFQCRKTLPATIIDRSSLFQFTYSNVNRVHNPCQVQLTKTGTYSQIPSLHFLNQLSSRIRHHFLLSSSSQVVFNIYEFYFETLHTISSSNMTSIQVYIISF